MEWHPDIFIHPIAWSTAILLIGVYPVHEFVRRRSPRPEDHERRKGAVAMSLTGLVILAMLIFG